MLEGEVQVSFEVPPEVRWRPLSRWSIGLVVAGHRDRRRAPSGSTSPVSSRSASRRSSSAGSSRPSGWCSPSSASGCAAATGSAAAPRRGGESPAPRPLRDRAGAARRPRPSSEDLLAAPRARRRRGGRGAAAPRGGTRRARSSSAGRAWTGSSARSPRDVLPAAGTRPRSRSSRRRRRSRPSGRSPRSRARGSASRWRSRTPSERWSGPGTTRRTARARVEQNPVDAEEVAGLAERLASWTEELAALRRRERVYAATLREINAAEQATMQRATRYLERRMVGDIARITGGRYRRVRVDDTNLGIDVFAPERNDWVPVTRPVPGDARRRLPGRAPRARPAGHRRPAAAAHPRRPVRDAGRRPGAPRAGAAARDLRGLPGDLPDDVGPVRRASPTAWSSCRGRSSRTRTRSPRTVAPA